jgi:hypothetical protein
MTRLVNFGLGEICDRLTILGLKILYGEEKQLDVAHFRNERTTLVIKLLTASTGKWIEAYADLAAVNAALWHAEADLRGYAKNRTTAPPDAVMHCAFCIQAWNDRRAFLVQQINEHVGDKAQEKV